jgi:hypothetical protein
VECPSCAPPPPGSEVAGSPRKCSIGDACQGRSAQAAKPAPRSGAVRAEDESDKVAALDLGADDYRVLGRCQRFFKIVAFVRSAILPRACYLRRCEHRVRGAQVTVNRPPPRLAGAFEPSQAITPGCGGVGSTQR